MSRQICSHTPSAINAGAKRSGATCHMAMPQCCYLAKGAKRPSHTTNMLTSSNISVNWSIWSPHLVDTFVVHVTDAILSPKWLVTKCPWPVSSCTTNKFSFSRVFNIRLVQKVSKYNCVYVVRITRANHQYHWCNVLEVFQSHWSWKFNQHKRYRIWKRVVW